MLVDDRIIAEIIVRIGRHYNENIATRFLRPLFAQILSNIDLSRHIVDLTEHSEDFVLQGFHLDDLYYDIIALARFIYLVRRDVLPNINSIAEANTKMAMVLELYRATLQYDTKMAGKGKTVASRIADLADMERLLTNVDVDA